MEKKKERRDEDKDPLVECVAKYQLVVAFLGIILLISYCYIND